MIKSFFFQLPAIDVQLYYLVGFRISPSREGAIFRNEIENYFSCSHLARRDRDYHMTILVFRDENEIPFCYSHVSRRDRDFRKSFLVVEREKWSWLSSRIPGIENSRWPLLRSLNVLMPCAGKHGCPPLCKNKQPEQRGHQVQPEPAAKTCEILQMWYSNIHALAKIKNYSHEWIYSPIKWQICDKDKCVCKLSAKV